uniref:Uncharacterized protein n=1 Tax=Sphaerodactylus townsendi TaxID=933632 RepID=A0ACB8FJD4_9SAUR
METLSAVRAKVGARSPGSYEVAGPGEPKPASSSSPAGRGSPATAAPESHAYRLEDLETLATVALCGTWHFLPVCSSGELLWCFIGDSTRSFFHMSIEKLAGATLGLEICQTQHDEV